MLPDDYSDVFEEGLEGGQLDQAGKLFTNLMLDKILSIGCFSPKLTQKIAPKARFGIGLGPENHPTVFVKGQHLGSSYSVKNY